MNKHNSIIKGVIIILMSLSLFLITSCSGNKDIKESTNEGNVTKSAISSSGNSRKGRESISSGTNLDTIKSNIKDIVDNVNVKSEIPITEIPLTMEICDSIAKNGNGSILEAKNCILRLALDSNDPQFCVNSVGDTLTQECGEMMIMKIIKNNIKKNGKTYPKFFCHDIVDTMHLNGLSLSYTCAELYPVLANDLSMCTDTSYWSEFDYTNINSPLGRPDIVHDNCIVGIYSQKSKEDDVICNLVKSSDYKTRCNQANYGASGVYRDIKSHFYQFTEYDKIKEAQYYIDENNKLLNKSRNKANEEELNSQRIKNIMQ